jgi:LysM repeat protein
MKVFRRFPLALVLSIIVSCTTTPESSEELGEEMVVDDQQSDISTDALDAENLAAPDLSAAPNDATEPAEELAASEPVSPVIADPAPSEIETDQNSALDTAQPESPAVAELEQSSKDLPQEQASSNDESSQNELPVEGETSGITQQNEDGPASSDPVQETPSSAESEVSTTQIETIDSSSTDSLITSSDSYIVRPGDTLSKIATKLYGTASAAAKIAQMNSIDNPDLIFPGDVLKVEQSGVQTASSNTEETREVTVESGDTLSKIAEKVFGDPGTWKYIWKLNESRLPDPNRIEPGIKLSIVVPGSSLGAEESH